MFAVADFLNADAFVNMPVCKNHGGAGLSISLKNWMGSVRERRDWHKDSMQQRIADSISVFRPAWTIVDATRVMLKNGPQGPSPDMNVANMLVLSKDQVAADSFCAQEFWKGKTKATHIQLAADMGLGVADLSKIDIARLEV